VESTHDTTIFSFKKEREERERRQALDAWPLLKKNNQFLDRSIPVPYLQRSPGWEAVSIGKERNMPGILKGLGIAGMVVTAIAVAALTRAAHSRANRGHPQTSL
jgi:hypothetical protein